MESSYSTFLPTFPCGQRGSAQAPDRCPAKTSGVLGWKRICHKLICSVGLELTAKHFSRIVLDEFVALDELPWISVRNFVVHGV